MGWNDTANQLDELPKEVRGEEAYADPTVFPIGHARSIATSSRRSERIANPENR